MNPFDGMTPEEWVSNGRTEFPPEFRQAWKQLFDMKSVIVEAGFTEEQAMQFLLSMIRGTQGGSNE